MATKDKTNLPPSAQNDGTDNERLKVLVLKPVLRTERTSRDPESILAEAVGLAEAINLHVVMAELINLAHPTPATLLGSGQTDYWGGVIAEESISLAIVDHALSPVQQRNLEQEWKCKVIDRTGLILEIFGDRARTKEGQLQVELAALDYQKSRLVRSWTHLERQRGGFGFMGGPGESQLEIDRRLIATRMSKLKEELEQVQRMRGLQRDTRQKAEKPIIALVGYTNAGKSTLFNRLTGADVLAKNMLFATLDPTMRGIVLPCGREVMVSDTVGFISDLPTHLVKAFHATLEEVQYADIILHVRDIAHPDTRSQRDAVLDVLATLGIEATDSRLLEVLNKADLLPESERKNLDSYARRVSEETGMRPSVDGVHSEASAGMVAVSALTGEGIAELMARLSVLLNKQNQNRTFCIPLSDGAAIAWLYEHARVLDRRDGKKDAKIQASIDESDFGRFINKFPDVVHVDC